jgi:hypothetical protein
MSKKGRKLNLTPEQKHKRVKSMLKGKADAAAARKKAGLVKPPERPEVMDYPSVGKDVDKYGPRNLEFEQKLGVPPPEPPAAAKEKTTPAEDQHMLDLKIVADFMKLPFGFWASRADLPALRLTDQEAREWAEPTVTLLDYYLPKIPGIVYAWIAWTVCTCTFMDKRFGLVTAEHKKRLAQKSSESQAGPQSRQPNPGTPAAQGAPHYEPKRV